MSVIGSIKDFWINQADPRSLQMILLKSPYPILSAFAIYFVTLFVSF